MSRKILRKLRSFVEKFICLTTPTAVGGGVMNFSLSKTTIIFKDLERFSERGFRNTHKYLFVVICDRIRTISNSHSYFNLLNFLATLTKFFKDGTVSSHFLVFNPQSGFIQICSLGIALITLLIIFSISCVRGIMGE